MSSMTDGSQKQEDEAWRVLEFYSGIGGMRYSLREAGIKAKVVEAFDINDRANDVYEHNFDHRPYQGNIQSLTAADLDSYGAHGWLLSPPCQPYTRQGLQKDSDDARAFSFLKILELIPHTSQPPSVLFVENVVGFEFTSVTRAKMIDALAKTNYVVQEFILSPLQFGIPYSRPRYFCLAKRRLSSFKNQLLNDRLLWSPSPLFGHDDITGANGNDQSQGSLDNLLQSCEPVEKFLEVKNCNDQIDIQCGFLDTSIVPTDAYGALEKNDDATGHADVNGHDGSFFGQYLVPLSLIERWGSVMDIVYPDSKRCCCFTKSYYRYVKGTGSLLATVQPKKKGKSSPLKEQCLRYFTPREVANLHSFPEDFDFPQHISLKQRYALLGNSLSIAVVAPLLRYLFAEPSV